MNLFRNAIIPLIAILILLALLVAAIVLIYEQKGLLLPFASQPDEATAETTVCAPKIVLCLNENTLFSNWRILK